MKINLLLGVIIGLVLISTPVWAGDYRSYSTSELMGMRDTIHRMPQHEQDAFNQEMNMRLLSTSSAERARYGWHMNDGHIDAPGYHHDQNGYMNRRTWGGGYRRSGWGHGNGGCY